jgi:ligand-binding SRPBCC domain-containing protein
MPVYHREVRVGAPFDEVWEFHSQISGLEALTPGWMNLEIESVTGPDGEPDPDVLDAGSRAESSMRPFGVGPRQEWTSEILVRERDGDTARFVDEMTDGPFAEWEHSHLFYGDGDDTIVCDRVEYAFPGGSVGRAVSPLGWVGFEPMFRYRHRKTRELLEDGH